MSGRPRTVTDDEILSAVGRAIARHGPARLTLAHVAAEVGLAAPTLVQRFGSKRGLMLALAARGADDFRAAFARGRAEGAPPLTALYATLAGLVAEIDSPETLANHLAFLQLDLTDPELREHAVAQSREMREQIRGLLDAAVAAGDLIPCDAARLAQAVYTTYNGALVSWAIDGEGPLPAWTHRELDTLLAPYHRVAAAVATRRDSQNASHLLR
jgi:AcrR family transcriptional regulator